MKAALAILTLAAFAVGQEPAAVKGTARAADGVSIAYDARGKGDTALVFIHGWCGDRSYWNEQLDHFAKDYRVVAVDVAGHGESGTNRQKWTIAGLAGDVEAVVKELGLKRVVLIGHSMGGPISLVAAKRMPDRVIGVVGVDTLHNAELDFPKDQREAFAAKFEADFPGTMAAGIKMMFPENKADPALVKRLTEKAVRTDPKVALALFRDFNNIDLKADLAGAKVPVRCVNSTPWGPFSIPTAVDINRKHADFDAVLMEGTGHYPMLERPSEFNEKLAKVLKGLAAR